MPRFPLQGLAEAVRGRVIVAENDANRRILWDLIAGRFGPVNGLSTHLPLGCGRNPAVPQLFATGTRPRRLYERGLVAGR